MCEEFCCGNRKEEMNRVFLGFGSNLGDKKRNLLKAVSLLDNGGYVKKKSSIYETAPIGYLEQDNFLNMVVEFYTEIDAGDLLVFLQGIEERLGKKIEIKHGPRTIDIDILFFEDLVINEKDLIIPHPGIKKRAFVLLPLIEIEPDFKFPDGEKIKDLLENVKDQEIKKY